MTERVKATFQSQVEVIAEIDANLDLDFSVAKIVEDNNVTLIKNRLTELLAVFSHISASGWGNRLKS